MCLVHKINFAIRDWKVNPKLRSYSWHSKTRYFDVKSFDFHNMTMGDFSELLFPLKLWFGDSNIKFEYFLTDIPLILIKLNFWFHKNICSTEIVKVSTYISKRVLNFISLILCKNVPFSTLWYNMKSDFMGGFLFLSFIWLTSRVVAW